MRLTIVISLALMSFFARLLSWALYDKDIAVDLQDYVFDIMAVSELFFVGAAFLLTYLILPYTKKVAFTRSVFRITLFSTAFTTGKELSGLNTTEEPFEALIFCFMLLVVGYYSLRRIKSWEKTANKV